jgi:hypothetical protein
MAGSLREGFLGKDSLGRIPWGGLPGEDSFGTILGIDFFGTIS